MVFKATSFNKFRLRRHRSGVTLVETMISVLIASLLGLVICTSMIHGARSFSAMANYIDLDRQSRNALDIMLADVRQAARLINYDPGSFIELRDFDGSVLKFIYDPDKKNPDQGKRGGKAGSSPWM